MSNSYPFKIVLFPDDGGMDYSVDIAPERWIFYSEAHKSIVCRFPCGPFSEADIIKLHKMVKKTQSADDSWPVHRIIIIGRAKTYPEALKAVKKVEYHPYAFSTDEESSVERKIEEENSTHPAADGKKTDINDEFNDVVFELINTHPSGQKKRLPQKSLPKKLLKSRSESLLSNESSTEDSEKEKDELLKGTNDDDEFPPLDPDADLLEKSLENIELNEPVINQKSNSTHHVTVNKPSPSFSNKSKSSSSTVESPAMNVRRDKSSTWPAEYESSVTPNRRKIQTTDDDHSSSDDNSNIDSDDGKKSKSQDNAVYLTPGRKIDFSKGTLNSSSRLMKRKRRSSSADELEYTKREEHRRYSRSLERDITMKTVENQNGSLARGELPDSVIAAVNGLHAYVKQIHNSLSSKIDRLRGGQVETNGHIQELKDSIAKNPQQQGIDGFEYDDLSYGEFTLPVESKKDFYLFDAAMKDRDYLGRVVEKIKRMISKDEITVHSLGTIMRVFMSKTVIHKEFTALRGTEIKDAFMNTNLYRVLRVVHQRLLKDKIDDKKFNRILKGVFNAAGDWEGGRLERARKSL